MCWRQFAAEKPEIDEVLARKCFEEGYWTEPEAWDSSSIEATGIAIGDDRCDAAAAYQGHLNVRFREQAL